MTTGVMIFRGTLESIAQLHVSKVLAVNGRTLLFENESVAMNLCLC